VNPFIPALLAKLTLILALGLIVAATLRASSPSLRHLVLFATLASCLALPAIMLLSPEWNVRLLPSSFAENARVARNVPPSATAPDTRSIQLTDPESSISLTAISDPLPAGQFRVPGTGYRAPVVALSLLYLLGLSAVLAWLAIGRFRLRRIGTMAWPLDDPEWTQILDEERRESGVTKSVQLCSSSVVSTPLTWGWTSPIILLPEDALDWSEDHRRIVLRHELAHVARGDALSQLVAGVACALYWFHPLVWVAERRLRAECERACDDRVVSLGTPAADYAAHLLEVARSARAFGAPGFLSVAMARPSQLEGRLLAVLNGSRQRVSLSPGARRLAIVLSAIVLLPLAAFRAVPKATSSKTVNDSASTAAPVPSSSFSISTDAPAKSSSAKGDAIASTSNRIAPAIVETPATPADSSFQLSAPVKSGGTLNIDLKTGGNLVITSWDKPQVVVRASLSGRDWRRTDVRLRPYDGDATLESEFTGASENQSSHHAFEIQVPKNFNVRVKSSGGSVSITGVDGRFTGNTGGGEINIVNANGDVDLNTGGGDIRVTDSNLNGSVATGGGVVRIQRVNGNLSGSSGSGPVVYSQSTRNHSGYGYGSGNGGGKGDLDVITNVSGGQSTTSYIHLDPVGKPVKGSFPTSASTGSSYYGIMMNSAGGDISLPSAPDGALVKTGGGRIRVGPSGGLVSATTGGGDIDVGPASGSVEAHTGAGRVAIELKGPDSHAVEVTSGKGDVVLDVPANLNATLELETAYTNNFGHKTRIVSDWPLTTTETSGWDSTNGTPRRYVRARQNIGKGGAVIRVRTVNGNIVLQKAT
jgi:beta-lactamase regulating signal transducer with metallopeptidase domain